MLSKNHYISLASGRFDDTQLSDLDAAFKNLDSTKPKSGLVIHFHGGLVNEQAAVKSAEGLLKAYTEAGAYPFFFVWESGLWETFRNNLREIADETLFRKIVGYLIEHLLEKLGVSSVPAAAESLTLGKSPHQEVEDWIKQQETPANAVSSKAPFDGIRNEEARKGLTGLEVDKDELEAAMRGDSELEGEIKRLSKELNQPPPPTEANDSGLGYKTPGHLSPNALQELTGAHEHPGQVPQVDESIVGIGITVGRVAIAAARIGYRVVRRYSQGRDHGLYTTVVEEVLRDLYIGQLGSALFWNQMKRDTLDSFGDNDNVCGGTAFLRRLVKRFDKSLNPPLRVTLIGHSAGAIYLCNFLINAHREFKQQPDVKFDVVMLAPAVDFDLFNQAIQTRRIANFRSFGLSDRLEAADALLAPFSSTLKYVFPKSLLYLVSGLLETEVDRPLVGMERYYLGQQYTGRLFSAVAAVKIFFGGAADRLIWSPAKGKQPGLNTESTRHMDFNHEATTLASVHHILESGFAQAHVPDSGLESLPVERVTESDLEVLVDRLGDSEAIQALNQFSLWFDSNTSRKLQTVASQELNSLIAKSMPITSPNEILSDGEWAKITLKLAAQDERCQKPLVDIFNSANALPEGSSTLQPNSILVGLQSQLNIDDTDGNINVRVRQPSYALSRSVAEYVARNDEKSRATPRASELVINEDRMAAALAELHPSDLAAVYKKVWSGDPPEVTESSRKVDAWQLVNDSLNRGEDLEDLLIAANLVVPSAGLLQRFLAKDKKVSRTLRSSLSAAPDMGGLESVSEASIHVSPMTLRLRSSDISLDKVPGLTVISKMGTIVAAEGTAESLVALEANEDVLTIEGPSAGFATLECVNSMPYIKATVAKSKAAEGGDQCLVVIIDGGIDVMHQSFCSATNQAQTRLVGVWDLTDQTGKQNVASSVTAAGALLPPQGFEAAGGTWHSQAAINGYLASGVLGGQLQRDPGGHGTHVASIAAGTRPANVAQQAKFPGGVAHDAQILAIVIGDSEFEQGSPSQIGYSKTLISALEFSLAKAKELKLPVVVNLSQGQHSGGHDGTTALEAAIDTFTLNGRAEGRAVVKSAGNSRSSLGHAYVTMSPGFQENLEWNSDVQKNVNGRVGRLCDVIEVWFNPSEQMGFLLITPDSATSNPVNFANPNAQGTFPNGNVYTMEYVKHFRDNGLGRLRIEIRKGSAKAIRDGKWQLEMVNSDLTRSQELHAWVEISDWQPAQFLSFAHVETTLTVPGTANSVITVAAVQTAANGRVASFSCYGKTRDDREKPEIAAPGVGILAAESGTTSGVIEKKGTSMAAPHVSGALALVFSAARKKGFQVPSANDVRQAFRSFSTNNHWDRGSGYGVLNVDALLQYFSLYPPPAQTSPAPPPQLAGAPVAGS